MSNAGAETPNYPGLKLGSAYSLPRWRCGRGRGGLELRLRNCPSQKDFITSMSVDIHAPKDGQEADRIPVASPAEVTERPCISDLKSQQSPTYNIFQNVFKSERV